MEKEKQATQVVPMEEDETSGSDQVETTIIHVEEATERVTTEEAGPDGGDGAAGATRPRLNDPINVDVRYIVEDADPLDEDMKNCCMLTDDEDDEGAESIEIQSDYSLDDEDMEIQKLTQSLQELGTGRIQRSLLSDQIEAQPDTTFEGK
ncbi:uncharacterized protein [Hetaerina americana]